MWENIGVLGRVFVIVGIQIIACYIFGFWGLLLYPALSLFQLLLIGFTAAKHRRDNFY
jgi:hypothetical protein